MTKSISVGYTDTAISGVSSLTFPRGLVNYGKDFRVKDNSPSEVVITNLTSPVDRPETFRIGYQEIPNIYAGKTIDPSVYAPSKRGVKILTQVAEVWSETDSADATYRRDVPVSAQLVIQTGSLETITTSMLLTLVGRLVSGLFETGSLTTERLQAMLRGSLTPTDI